MVLRGILFVNQACSQVSKITRLNPSQNFLLYPSWQKSNEKSPPTPLNHTQWIKPTKEDPARLAEFPESNLWVGFPGPTPASPPRPYFWLWAWCELQDINWFHRYPPSVSFFHTSLFCMQYISKTGKHFKLRILNLLPYSSSHYGNIMQWGSTVLLQWLSPANWDFILHCHRQTWEGVQGESGTGCEC